MGQRQDPGQRPAALAQQIMGAMAEGALDDALPAGEMKECRFRNGTDKRVPAPFVARPQRSYGDGGSGSCVSGIDKRACGASVRNNRSIRVHV